MKYNCPHCQQPYELEKDGKYKCLVCDTEFDFTVPAPATVTITQPEPQEPSEPQRCPFCMLEIPAGARKCGHCGEWVNADDQNAQKVNRAVYILLSFLFGHFGIHKFYADHTFTGFIYLLITLTGFGVSLISESPIGFVIVGFLGVLQFIFALLDNVGMKPKSAREKKPETLADKIFFWLVYSIVGAIIVGTVIIAINNW